MRELDEEQRRAELAIRVQMLAADEGHLHVAQAMKEHKSHAHIQQFGYCAH